MIAWSFSSLQGIYPELIVLLGAFLVLSLELFWPEKGTKNRVFYLSLLSLAGALLAFGAGWSHYGSEPFPGFLTNDYLSSAGKGLVLLICFLAMLISRPGALKLGLEHAEYYALLLLATFGMMLLAGSSNFISAFVSLETFSLAMYVLAGFNKKIHANREAALKYFLLGAFAAAFFLFGMVFIYASTGNVSYASFMNTWHSPAASHAQHLCQLIGLLLVLVAFAFKVGLVPFHLWVPDTYEGAPTPVSAFLSAGAKVAGMVAMLRLVLIVLPDPFHALLQEFQWSSLSRVLAILSVLTMTLANFAALRQDSLKRLLAYSSISHSGYALLGLVAGNADGGSAVLVYVLVYALMNFCAFGLVAALENGLSEPLRGKTITFADLNGLGFAHPFFGAAMAVAMLSLAGLPPTAGFIAKFGLFKAAVEAGQVNLVVVAVLNSLVAAGYYLRVLVSLYMKPFVEQGTRPEFRGVLAWSVLGCSLLLLLFGVLPGFMLDFGSISIQGLWH